MTVKREISNGLDAPYKLSKEEWEKRFFVARDRLRGNMVQCRATNSEFSKTVGALRDIEWLNFGVDRDNSAKLDAVRSGAVVLSPWGRKRFIYVLENGPRYVDVIFKAKRLGLL